MKDLKYRICRKSNSVPTLVSLIVIHHCQSPGRLMKVLNVYREEAAGMGTGRGVWRK